MGIFDNIFGAKKGPADFSGVRSGSSTTAPSAPAGTPGFDPARRTYVVARGDSLSKIARREYGEASKWPAIYEANRDRIKDPDLIYPGQVLTLPDNA